MELLKQTNNFDCGICSLMMLLQHYKIKNVSKEELYENVYVEKTGISIMELEVLAHKYGIFLDSYEATFNEIIHDKSIKNPFILVTSENDNLHYVVGIKKKNEIQIFDPKGVVKNFSSETPLENYVDILIKTEKLSDNLKYKTFSKKKKLNFVNPSFIIFNTLINLLLLGINFLTSFITSQLINKIGLLDIFALLAIVFGLIIFYVINSLLEYVVFRLSFKKLNKMFLLNLNFLMNKYNFKLPGFYKTIDRNIFNNGHNILKNNIFFVNEFICNCIISSLFLIIASLLIFFTNTTFLFFVLINIFVILIISLFEHKYTNELTKVSIENSNKISELIIKINQFNISNFSYKLNNLLFYKLKNKIKKSEYSVYKINKKKVWTDIIKNLWSSIFYLIIITYYVFVNKNNKIGNLFFCLQIISTLNKYCLELIDCISDSINFKIIKEMLSNLYNINNLQKNQNNDLFNLTPQKPLLIKKINFDFNQDIKDDKFKINNTQITKINHFNDSCHYIKYETLTDLVLNLIKKEIKFDNQKLQNEFNKFMRNKILNENEIYTQIDYLIIYLFYLSTLKDQIILLDTNLEINNLHKYYELFNDLFINNKENNMLVFINSLIINEIEHTEIDLDNEKDL